MEAGTTLIGGVRQRGEAAPRVDRGAMLIVGVLTLLMLGLFARVVQLQVMPPKALQAFMGDRATVVTEDARRGDILDRAGRVLAATRFGFRAYVDPVEFKRNPDIDSAITRLASALGSSPAMVGQKIMARVADNERRQYDAQFFSFKPGTQAAVKGPPLVRFVPLGGVLDDSTVDSVKRLGLKGVHLETRPVREVTSDDLVAVLVGKVGFEQIGLMAAEKVFDDLVKPTNGQFKYVRDARGQPLWVEPDGYDPPVRGQDVHLSIDLEVQRILLQELERGLADADAQGIRGIVLDPNTGEVLAMADLLRNCSDAVPYDWMHVIPHERRGGEGPRYIVLQPDPKRAIHPALGRNRCVEDLYEPGSTFKPFMWSTATDLGVASEEETIDTENGSWSTPYGRHIGDVVKAASMTWAKVLVNSSNIGMVKVVSRLTWGQTRDAILKFGFGSKTNIGLPGETAGLVTSMKAWSKYTQTSVAFGHEISVTPLQMARAFSAFCRDGDMAGTIPQVRLVAATPSDLVSTPPQRAISPDVALRTRETLRGVTHNLDKRMAAGLHEGGPKEGDWRYELFGKSGTPDTPLGLAPPGKKRPKGSDGYFKGQYTPTFIAGGPVERPKLVCLVIVDDPGPELIRTRKHYGAYTAGPVVRRVMDRSLAYLGVPASPPAPDVPAAAE